MKKFIILLIVCTTQLFSQDFESNVSKRAVTAAPFLNISQGARATGMGSAFVAVADDPSAVFWNVAGLARLKQNGVMLDHTRWIADLKYNFVGFSFNTGSFGTLGLSLISSDYGEMKVRTIDQPEGTGEVFSVNDVAFGLAWSTNLTDNFSIGFQSKVIYQSIWRMSDYAFAFDMGILYDTPFEGITLGMSITNFGSTMKLSGTNAVVLYDLDEQSAGNNDKIPASLDTDEWDLPLNYRVGISYQAFQTNSHSLIFALDAMHPNDNYESINLGAEYTFLGQFAIRGGYKSLFLPDSEESFTLGAGFKQLIIGNVNFKFDYFYGDFGRLNDIQKFSIGVNF